MRPVKTPLDNFGPISVLLDLLMILRDLLTSFTATLSLKGARFYVGSLNNKICFDSKLKMLIFGAIFEPKPIRNHKIFLTKVVIHVLNKAPC